MTTEDVPPIADIVNDALKDVDMEWLNNLDVTLMLSSKDGRYYVHCFNPKKVDYSDLIGEPVRNAIWTYKGSLDRAGRIINTKLKGLFGANNIVGITRIHGQQGLLIRVTYMVASDETQREQLTSMLKNFAV